MESRFLHKEHNVSVLMYHVVCAAKYRLVVMSEKVDLVMKKTCLEIAKRYEIRFLEIGLDGDHAHFLIQSVPTYSPTRIVQTMKSITASTTVQNRNRYRISERRKEHVRQENLVFKIADLLDSSGRRSRPNNTPL
jgi:REP element-mobilizing transposase RayT